MEKHVDFRNKGTLAGNYRCWELPLVNTDIYRSGKSTNLTNWVILEITVTHKSSLFDIFNLKHVYIK